MNCPICKNKVNRILTRRRPDESYEYRHNYICRCNVEQLSDSFLFNSFSYTAYGTKDIIKYIDVINICLPSIHFSWAGLSHVWWINSCNSDLTTHQLATGEKFIEPAEAYQLLLRYQKLMPLS